MIKKCPMCKRDLAGIIEEHHLIPKMFTGKITEKIHKICHEKIHRTFTEKELEKKFNNWEEINLQIEIKKFVEWIKDKPTDYYIKSINTNSKRKKK